VSTATNPWGAIYKIAAWKRSTITQLTTLRKPDETTTADTKETLSLMMESIAPRDNREDDKEYHIQIRALTEQPANTVEDREFKNQKLGTSLRI
jgi:hypothetical protein